VLLVTPSTLYLAVSPRLPSHVGQSYSRRCTHASPFFCTVSGRCFIPVRAEITDHAPRAVGFARLAHVAPMQDQPVMRIETEFGPNRLHEFVFDCADIFSLGEPGTVGDPENMRIDRYGRLAKSRVEHDI